MDVEFHYYMTYLIATKSGFSPQDATILAYSSQYVDDNSKVFKIDAGKTTEYSNYITQTLNILKPRSELMRIYPLFHFIPGDSLAPSAWRKDGKLHLLNTTPNSNNANRIMEDALHSKNLYRIGIASHSYADTWAHQNFVGYYDEFNAMKGVLSSALPNIGHADMKRYPDWPAFHWQDCRLIAEHENINNTQRFLDAAQHLFYKYRYYLDRACPTEIADRHARELKTDLEGAIGDRDPKNIYKKDRIQRYIALSSRKDYGGQILPPFNKRLWFDRAITRQEKEENKTNFQTNFFHSLASLKNTYFWRENYQQSHWYRFQEAAKKQQKAAWDILYATTLHHLELEQL